MSKENSELAMLRLNYDIEKLKHFLYLAEQSQKEAVEIIAEFKAENKKLKEKLETLQDEIGYLKSVLGQIKDLAMCVADCEQDCDHCMQGQIHQLIKEALNGRED